MYYLGICQCYQLYLIISLYLVPYCPTLQSMQSLKSKQLLSLNTNQQKSVILIISTQLVLVISPLQNQHFWYFDRTNFPKYTSHYKPKYKALKASR